MAEISTGDEDEWQVSWSGDLMSIKMPAEDAREVKAHARQAGVSVEAYLRRKLRFAMNTTHFQTACDELKALGITLQNAPGEYRVNYSKGTPATEYLTDDLQDAIARGREMAAQPSDPAEPPLGPTAPARRDGASCIGITGNSPPVAFVSNQPKSHEMSQYA